MIYTLQYLDQDYRLKTWHFFAANLEVAELIAGHFCARMGYTFADVLQ